MHPQYHLAAILSISTLAIPTFATPLEKRKQHFGWIASYGTWDCSGPQSGIPLRPEVKSDCVKFKPDNLTTGIDFGSGDQPYAFTGLTVYSDDSCKTNVSYIQKPNSPNTSKGPYFCFEPGQYSTTWGSVKQDSSDMGE
ncbi:hypothetical protein MMC28_004728 [Mycoblastus sanguinarius]|nr:hypothetical protein [Mycoblastus sanguinarius]